MAKIDFSRGAKTREYLLTLHEVFPMIEHFLEEADWATLVFFLSEKKADLEDLKKIHQGLVRAEAKFQRYYPAFMPPKPKPTNRYAFEGVLAVAIYNMMQMLMHLRSLSDSFISTLERGQNPNLL